MTDYSSGYYRLTLALRHDSESILLTVPAEKQIVSDDLY